MGHTEERLERVERLLLGVIQHQGTGTPVGPGPHAAERLAQLRVVHDRDVTALTRAVQAQAPQLADD